jgi:hypothetical protein
MKKATYRILRFEQVAVTELDEHPAARMPIAEDDRHSISRSLMDGDDVYVPLLVVETGASAPAVPYLIVDGCNRWKAAREKDAAAMIPCCVIECSDPANVVRTCLAVGRKRSTGTRIMAYLEMHKRDVLAAWAVNGQKGENYRKSSKSSREDLDGKGLDFWSAKAISERLEVSQDDVGLGLELLRCLNERVTLEDPNTFRRSAADDDYISELASTRDRVICGATPIRTWRAAFHGKKYGGGGGRAHTQWDKSMERSIKAVTNGCLHWNEVPLKSRPAILAAWRDLLEVLPADLK